MLPLQCGNSKKFRWGGGTSPPQTPPPARRCAPRRSSFGRSFTRPPQTQDQVSAYGQIYVMRAYRLSFVLACVSTRRPTKVSDFIIEVTKSKDAAVIFQQHITCTFQSYPEWIDNLLGQLATFQNLRTRIHNFTLPIKGDCNLIRRIQRLNSKTSHTVDC